MKEIRIVGFLAIMFGVGMYFIFTFAKPKVIECKYYISNIWSSEDEVKITWGLKDGQPRQCKKTEDMVLFREEIEQIYNALQ